MIANLRPLVRLLFVTVIAYAAARPITTMAASNENYYTYQFPTRSPTFYDTLRADIPDWETLDPFDEGVMGWAYVYLKNLAQANELLHQGNPKLAAKYAADAASIYVKELQRCWATALTLDTFAVRHVRARMDSRMLVSPDEADANEQLASDLLLAQDKSICDAFRATSTGPSWSGANARAILFAFYYYRHFSHPMLMADVAREQGDYPAALRHTFGVLGDPGFYVPYSSSTDVEQFADYRRPSTPAGAANYGPGLAVADQPSLDERSRYGRCWFDMASAGRCSTWAEIDSAESAGTVSPLERRVLTKKIATLYLEWGDLLFRQQEAAAAGARYTQVLRIYRREWQTVMGLAPGNPLSINPEVLWIIKRADVQLRKLKAGLNYLGYSSTYVPIWSYRYLRDSAKHFVDMARSLERDALNFLASAEREFEQGIQLAGSADIARKMVAIERARVDQARTGVQIAQTSQQLAQLRLANHLTTIRDFQNTHPIATGRDMGFLNDVLNVFEGSEYGAEIGSFVGSVFGWSTSGGMQRREARDQYSQMVRETEELRLSASLAALEQQRAQQELGIAMLNRDIAEFDQRTKQEHLEVARSKTLNTQFWHELSRDVRKKAHQYLDYGIQLTWLTEQAYEFETASDVNLVKFDYLSTEGWLAADQLVLDLDTIEFDRLTRQRQKELPLTHTISLRAKDLIALERLKRDGTVVFETTAQDFDFAHPGTYNRRIKKVDVIVPALYGRDGFRGRLTKGALSVVNMLDARPPNGLNTFADWLQHTPSPSRRRLLATPEETMVLARQTGQAMSGGEAFNKEGEKRVFEDHGVTGTWKLEIPHASNDFDLGTIMDVLIRIDFTASYSEELKDAVLLERRKLEALGQYNNGSIVSLSMRQNLPDERYQFFNPSPVPSACPSGSSCVVRQTAQHRIAAFHLRASDAPPNQVNRRLSQLSLAMFNREGLAPGTLKVTSQRLNPTMPFQVRGDLLVLPAGRTLADLKWFPNDFPGATFDTVLAGRAFPVSTSTLAGLGAELLDTWLVRLDAIDNPELRARGVGEFNLEKLDGITDIVLQFAYRANVPGVANAPVTRWAHFSETGTAPSAVVVEGANPAVRAWTLASGATWAVNPATGTLFHAASTSTHSIQSPAGGGRFLPAGGFDVSLDVDLEDRQLFELSTRGTQARYDLQIQRTTTGGYFVRVHRFKDGVNSLPRIETDLAIPGSTLNLRIVKRRTAGGVRIAFEINGMSFYSVEESDVAFMDRLASLVLSTDGAVEVDNVVVADLTNYPE
jgi:hypothetical protein